MTSDGLPVDERETRQASIFSRFRLKHYALATIVLALPAAAYQLLQVALMGLPRMPEGPLPESVGPPIQTSMGSIWPLWGQVAFPSSLGVLALLLAVGLIGVLHHVSRKSGKISLGSLGMAGLGLVVAFMTNMAHGYDIGLWMPVGGGSELLSDALHISNPILFISKYAAIQPSLSVHAATQPPGAVLFIYFLYLLFSDPGLISLALCSISMITSVFFLNRVYRRHFSEETSIYASLLFVLLPAVQVYFLANIYAVVCSLFLGVLYFYFHENKVTSLLGSTLCIAVGTFISFLFVYAILFILLYEVLTAITDSGTMSMCERIGVFLFRLKTPVSIVMLVGVSYLALQLTLGFSYVGAFLYASASENPGGFMFFSSPLEYVITRIQDVMDIAIFLGPILLVLGVLGMRELKKAPTSNQSSKTLRRIVLAAVIALVLLFLTGAPKKGETARICMFILPILLIPVVSYLESGNVTWNERMMLLALVFLQTIVMQALFIFVW